LTFSIRRCSPSISVGERNETRDRARTLSRLGQLTFSLHADNQSIGVVQSVATNTTLRPQWNVIPLTGELRAVSLIGYAALLQVIQYFLTERTSQVEAVAGPNATSYPLLAVGMNNLRLPIEISPYDRQLISSLTFDAMSLLPSSTSKCVTVSSSIVITIDSPLGDRSPLHIEHLNMSASLVFQDESIGELDVRHASVEQINATTYVTRFNDTPLTLTGTGATYATFARQFIAANRTHPIVFAIVGRASIDGAFALGPLTVDSIAVNNRVSLVGLADLRQVRVHGISIDGNDERTLRLNINVTISNPGAVDVTLHDFTLHLMDTASGTRLGQVPVDSLALRAGDNNVLLHG
jgi:hypothetical protein